MKEELRKEQEELRGVTESYQMLKRDHTETKTEMRRVQGIMEELREAILHQNGYQLCIKGA